mgnify:CR=1 FL=1
MKTVSDNPQVQVFFEMLVEQGQSESMAEILATRRPPRVETDREFFLDHGMLAKQFQTHMKDNQKEMEYYLRVAKKMGHNPGANDVYVSSIARFPGDPEAFVPPTGGRGHVKKVLEERGWASSGIVNTKYREPEEDPREKAVPLSDRIVHGEMRKRIRENPDEARKDYDELKSEIVADHGPQT